MTRFCRLLPLIAVIITTPLRADDADTPTRPVPDSPIAAEATLDLFELHPDCRIELVAAEPDVIDPVHIAFDPAGRLWVVEYSDYPNGPGESEPGTSRIRVLTDEDGDGRYENPRVFADKLLFANGLMHWRDGVLVTMNGQLVFMRDTDGDGRADEQQPWFTGFKTENPQLRANHPTLGLDNHIYVASGIRGGDVTAVRPDWAEGAEPVSLSGRDFRFDPLTGEYESISGPAQFGLTFDDWGNRFIVSNRNPCDHIVLEGRYLERNPLVAVSSVVEHVSPIAGDSRVYPISRTWTTSNLHQGTFTAACGVCIYRGDALPADFYGNSFTCEPTGNLVHRDVLEPNGATFKSHYGRDGVEFLASTDEWFRPVNLTIGPDGALYVVDMYRAVIEHPQFMPEELKNRPDLFQGTDRGRIYRIVAADAPPAVERRPALLADASAEELVEALSHPNAWQRETAHRLLLEAEDGSLPESLMTVARTAESPQARAHALWLLNGMDALDLKTLEVALRDRNPRVTEQGVRLFDVQTGDRSELRSQLEEIILATGDEQLRFQAILSLSRARVSSRTLLTRFSFRPPRDQWIIDACAIAAESPGRLLVGLMDDPSIDVEWLERIARLVGRENDPRGIASVLRSLSEDNLPQAAVVLAGIGSGLRQRGVALEKVLGDSAIRRIYFLMARAATEDMPNRRYAITALEFGPWPAADRLLDIAAVDPEQSIRVAAINALARHSDPKVGSTLAELLPGASPRERQAIVSTMLANVERTRLLLDAIEAGDVAPLEIDPARARQLMNHRDPEIKAKAQELLADATPADRQKVLARYQESLTMESDPLRGREVFKQTCVQCHHIGTLGVDVAPDISDSRTKTREQLLTSILDPNRAIDNNYFSYSILDTEGVVHTGVISSETATAVTLKQPEGKQETILRSNIEEMRSTGLSLMPVGLEEKVSPQQMADLISFIKNWRYLDGLVPEEVIR